MKYAIILTALLWYENVPQNYETDWPHHQFQSIEECRNFLHFNKYQLTSELFRIHGTDENGNVLRTYEYFCKTHYYTDI